MRSFSSRSTGSCDVAVGGRLSAAAVAAQVVCADSRGCRIRFQVSYYQSRVCVTLK